MLQFTKLLLRQSATPDDCMLPVQRTASELVELHNVCYDRSEVLLHGKISSYLSPATLAQDMESGA